MTELNQPADLVAGHYRILGRARTDQEAITYRAEDVRSRERVALLVLRDSSDDSASALNAFRVGIHRWFGLEHPTLPEPLEAGHDRGVSFDVHGQCSRAAGASGFSIKSAMPCPPPMQAEAIP